MTALSKRFDDKYAIHIGVGCWLWESRTKAGGYGVFWDGAKNRLAHRVSYERARGQIPKGLELDHLCRTPLICKLT
jgi:hypothetical protein